MLNLKQDRTHQNGVPTCKSVYMLPTQVRAQWVTRGIFDLSQKDTRRVLVLFMEKITAFGWFCFTLQVRPDFVLFIVHLTSRGGRTSVTVGLSAPLSNLVTAGHLLPTDVVMEVSVGPGYELPLTLTRLIGQIDQMRTFKCQSHGFARPNSLVVSHCSCISLRKTDLCLVCVIVSVHTLIDVPQIPVGPGWEFTDNPFSHFQILSISFSNSTVPWNPVGQETEISVDELAGITQDLIRRTTPSPASLISHR